MRMPIAAVAAALALSPLAVGAHGPPYYPPPEYPPAAAAPAPGPSPWYLALGLGTGTGWSRSADGSTRSFHQILTDDGTPGASDNGHLALNFQLGGRISPNVLVGFDLTGLIGFGQVLDSGFIDDTFVQIWNGDLMLTVFPMERGLFLRLGTGLSVLSSGIDAGGAGLWTSRYTGFNGTVGAGFAFPVGPYLCLTLNLDYSRQWYPGNLDGLRGSSTLVGYLGVGWY